MAELKRFPGFAASKLLGTAQIKPKTGISRYGAITLLIGPILIQTLRFEIGVVP